MPDIFCKSDFGLYLFIKNLVLIITMWKFLNQPIFFTVTVLGLEVEDVAYLEYISRHVYHVKIKDIYKVKILN